MQPGPRPKWSHLDLMCRLCAVKPSLTCHVLVCYCWPWQVSPEKAVFIEPDQKFIRTESIELIRTSHLWFTPYLCLPKPLHWSMKLITRSCCLLLAQLRRLSPSAQSFPAQTLIMSTTAFSRSFILLGKPSLHTLYAKFMLHLRMRFHGLVIEIKKKKTKPCQSLIVSCPYERE